MCGPSALLVLRSKGGDVDRLFKSEMCAVAHRLLATDLGSNLKAPALAAALQAPVIARPHMRPSGSVFRRADFSRLEWSKQATEAVPYP